MKHNRTNSYDCYYTIVFVTKYREEIFDTKDKQEAMIQMLTKSSEFNKSDVESIIVNPDHVIINLSFQPHIAPANIIKSFKGGTARDWFKTYPGDKEKLYGGHLWQPSYFIQTRAGKTDRAVELYINQQKKG